MELLDRKRNVILQGPPGVGKTFAAMQTEIPEPKIRIRKLEAAVRQLNAAIELFFADGDPIAVHTLASAAHQIIHDIVKQKGGPGMIFDSFVLKDEFRKEANRIMREPQNFFKHADNDPDGELEFNTRTPEGFIMFSLFGLSFLNAPPDEIRNAFSTWYTFHHPDHLTEQGAKLFASTFPSEVVETLTTISKMEFFRAYRLAAAQVAATSQIFRS